MNLILIFLYLELCNLNYKEFNDYLLYNLEKFYIINNIIFKSIRKFVFIDSWNNYENGNYLE